MQAHRTGYPFELDLADLPLVDESLAGPIDEGPSRRLLAELEVHRRGVTAVETVYQLIVERDFLAKASGR